VRAGAVEPEFVHSNTGGRREERAGAWRGHTGAGRPEHNPAPLVTKSRGVQWWSWGHTMLNTGGSGDLAGHSCDSCDSWLAADSSPSPGDTVSYTCCPRTAFSARTGILAGLATRQDSVWVSSLDRIRSRSRSRSHLQAQGGGTSGGTVGVSMEWRHGDFLSILTTRETS